MRRLIWGLLLDDPGAAPRAFFRHHALGGRAAGYAAGPLFERALRSHYRITRETVAASHAEAMLALHRLGEETHAIRKRRLFGEALTIADITAASLLGPLIAPAGSPWDGVSQNTAARSSPHRSARHGGGVWVLERYRTDRLPAP